jgi:hypothetical protein
MKPTTKLERIFTRYVGYIEPTADGSHPSFLSLSAYRDVL